MLKYLLVLIAVTCGITDYCESKSSIATEKNEYTNQEPSLQDEFSNSACELMD